jgi:hypothetical protein
VGLGVERPPKWHQLFQGGTRSGGDAALVVKLTVLVIILATFASFFMIIVFVTLYVESAKQKS